MGIVTAEQPWLLIVQIRLGDLLIFPPTQSPQCFLPISLTWRLIMSCFETSVVSLPPFSLVLYFQLASPLDAQSLCGSYVSGFFTDYPNWVSNICVD